MPLKIPVQLIGPHPGRALCRFSRWIEYGASPRGLTLPFDRCARARVVKRPRLRQPRRYCKPWLRDVLRHRILLNFEAEPQA